jgi:hypothetical protein
MLEARCVICGSPAMDHVALRYPLRAWVRHHLFQLRALWRGHT